MITRRRFLLAALGLSAAALVAPAAQAGGVRKRVLNSAVKRLMRRDTARDARTKIKPLSQPKRVWRYTNRNDAKKASRQGLPAGKHMTSGTTPGRPPKPETAQRRYGLPRKPDMRMTIELPKSHPVRRNKVLGGRPGTGEITSPKAIPPKAIEKVIPLK